MDLWPTKTRLHFDVAQVLSNSRTPLRLFRNRLPVQLKYSSVGTLVVYQVHSSFFFFFSVVLKYWIFTRSENVYSPKREQLDSSGITSELSCDPPVPQGHGNGKKASNMAALGTHTYRMPGIREARPRSGSWSTNQVPICSYRLPSNNIGGILTRWKWRKVLSDVPGGRGLLNTFIRLNLNWVFKK